MIDYFLKQNVAGAARLEIVDPAGEVIRRYASDDKVTPVNPDALSIPAFWVRTPETLSTAAGMHRWIWDLRPTPPPRPAGGGGGGFGRGGVAAVLPGGYTVRVIFGGESYKQPLIVKMDPRAR